jgi:hypothetical protein
MASRANLLDSARKGRREEKIAGPVDRQGPRIGRQRRYTSVTVLGTAA